MAKLSPIEIIAIIFVGITVLITTAGPFYYNTVVRAEPQGERIFYVTAKQWIFEPNEFTVRKGEKVTFIITSSDVSHGFQIIGYNVNVLVHPGEYVKVSFIADKTGIFEIRCSVYCGEPLRASGAGHWLMKATLKVIEA